ncbi:hypothetical protein DSM21852_28480 [Methylocystis bryophila]|uniref:BP74 N-terminal domain-containing protein n=2 Tax=Methylocystis bryophila TaxID=655015 RepID=A0A1W6MQ52_9HYPH|nr:hypothetical protein B1812_00065 [Methylocystis bryophila]BDV39595.1 hypothetical protein DSM21852_28480 [Methylocystis bryophila]
MKHSLRASLVVLLSLTAAAVAAQEPRYFLMSDGKPENDFVFELRDPEQIANALRIIHDHPEPPPHVSGIIVLTPAPYNRPWGFHYEPRTISFPEISTEVCDAETSYVQKHLDEVGGHFLPGNRWCPWSQHVIKEMPSPR